MEPEY